MRLVVQLRAKTSGPGAPRHSTGAIQRVVTKHDLERGIELGVFCDGASLSASRVVAWLEPDGSELEFGALNARPRGAFALETAELEGDVAEIRFGAEGVAAAA